jgi:hypothetical protein
VNPKKVQLGLSKVFLLGQAPDEDRVQVIKDYPAPGSPQEVMRFLGMAGYCRRFIPRYADIVLPLTELTRSDRAWSWGQKEQEAFDLIRQAIAHAAGGFDETSRASY